MTLAELDQNIETFRRRANDPELTEAQRAVFQQALEGALKKREELFGNQAEEPEQPLAKKSPKPKAAEGGRPDVLLTTPETGTKKKRLFGSLPQLWASIQKQVRRLKSWLSVICRQSPKP